MDGLGYRIVGFGLVNGLVDQLLDDWMLHRSENGQVINNGLVG